MAAILQEQVDKSARSMMKGREDFESFLSFLICRREGKRYDGLALSRRVNGVKLVIALTWVRDGFNFS